MPQRTIGKRQFKFTAGLNTESGYLAPVPNTWADGLNMVPNLNGEIARRNRIDIEDNNGTFESTADVTAVSLNAHATGEWAAAAGDGTLNFAVVQHGATLYFRPNSEPISGTATFSIDLTPYQVAGTPLACRYVPCTFASGSGRFFVVSAAIDPIVVTLNSDHVSVSVTRIGLKIRDFIGATPDMNGTTDLTVGDGLRVHPATLTPAHRYNLQNQGWDFTHINYFHSGGVPFGEAAGEPDTTRNGASTYPSNVDQQKWGDDSVLVTRADSASGLTYAWSHAGVLKIDANISSRAPRGKYVISPFGNDRGTVSGVTGLPADTIVYTRPTTIAFHAGRAWYAGIVGRELGQWVLFSQVGVDAGAFGACYQAADPTSPDDSDLVASDGGNIVIHEAGTILKLLSFANLLVVVADNGVWQVTGGDAGGGFTATSYAVQRISQIGATNADAVVMVNDRIFYWSESAIMQLTLPQTSVSGQLVAEPITDATIASYYTDINALAKRYCQGLYDPDRKVVYWFYDGGVPTGSTYKWKKTKLLVLDLRIGAWYPLEFENSGLTSPVSAFCVGMILTRSIARGVDLDIDVVDSIDNLVKDSNNIQVVVSLPTLASHGRVLKFICWSPTGSTIVLTAADMELRRYSDADGVVRFYDWFSIDTAGVSFPAFIETQWEEDGIGADKRFTTHYLTVFLKKSETDVEQFDDGGGS